MNRRLRAAIKLANDIGIEIQKGNNDHLPIIDKDMNREFEHGIENKETGIAVGTEAPEEEE